MKTKKTKKTVEAKGYTRIEAFAEAIRSKKEGKVEALISLSNRKYISKGGKDNEKEATTVVQMGLKVLVGMKIVSLEEGNYKLL